ncbi:MAG: putative RDD family membrane protein YckC [Moritella sp.]|jgi:uncharacterized RDD family membrane protein YckC
MAKKSKLKKVKHHPSQNPAAETAPIAGFGPRLGALIYDSLIVIGVAALASAIGMGIAEGLIYFNIVNIDGRYIDTAAYAGQQIWFSILVWGSVCGFYLWFWTHGGQTVGMRAWRLRVQNSDGTAISLTQALIRLATAALGLGNLQVPFDQKSRAFQDHWAHCDVLRLSKEQNGSLLRIADKLEKNNNG